MIILGIDPGTATTGFGVVDAAGGSLKHVAHGVIRTPSTAAMPERLENVYTRLTRLMEEYAPETIVTEQLFFSSNVTNAMQVGRATGVVLLAAAQRGVPWTEYRPVEVKLAVVGYGRGEKKQVQYMVQRLLNLDAVPRPDDAADALAVAVCHAHSMRMAAHARSSV